MGENKEDSKQILEELATITDKLQKLYPKSKTTIIVEMNEYDFSFTKRKFNIFDSKLRKFKIDISETEIVFVDDFIFSDDETMNEPITTPTTTKPLVFEKKKNLLQKLFFWSK